MPRGLRTSLPDGYFHVTTRGVDSCAIFRDDYDRLVFLSLYRECVERHGWETHVLCLMTTHYHFVVTSTQEGVSLGLQRLNGVHAIRFNRRHDRTGHLFGDRFSSRVIEEDAYLDVACRYVLENPVRAGLVSHAEDWPWSWSRHS